MSSSEDKQYAFNWSNHMNHIRNALVTLLNESVLVDVTLCCEGGRLTAHKVLLSMCSLYFRDVFKEIPCSHPIVILKGVNYRVMKNLLQFMYDGEVTVDSNDFTAFMTTAEFLQVCGLIEGIKERIEVNNEMVNAKTSRIEKQKRKTAGK